jgi:hypothetical protein
LRGMSQLGHSDLGQLLFLELLIIVVAASLDAGLIIFAFLFFIHWHSTGMSVILLIGGLVISFAAYWLIQRIGNT